MEQFKVLKKPKAPQKNERKDFCVYCRQPLESQAAINVMDKIADSLPVEEVNEWCTEWLLACADVETLADFVACAMARHEDLDLVVKERSGGDEK